MSRQQLRDLAAFREMAEAHIERLGEAIMARRKALGWSRARLGRETNAHEKTVERWEKAQTAGALDNIEAIAKALDMDRDELLVLAMPQPKGRRTGDPFAEMGGDLDERLARMEEALRRIEETQAYFVNQVEAGLAGQELSADAPPSAQDASQTVPGPPATGTRRKARR